MTTTNAPSTPLTLRQEILSDYVAAAGVAPSGLKPRLGMIARYITNPALHAVALIRVANRSPRWSWWFWRQVLMTKHAIDWMGYSQIGPGLRLPHPIGIVFSPGLTIGANVTINHNVSIGGDADNRGPVLGDNVMVFPGAVIIGHLRVGEGSVIGANSFVHRDVPARSVFKRGTAEPMRDSRLADAVSGGAAA